MRLAHLAVISTVLLLAARAEAGVIVGVDAGAGYWAVPTGTDFPGVAQFDAHLSVRGKIDKHFSVGLRPGFMVNVAPGVTYGIPVDVQFRAQVAIFYFEALGGVNYLIDAEYPWRFHAAVGAGLTLLGFSFGLEAGYLQPGFHGGLRIGFSI